MEKLADGWVISSNWYFFWVLCFALCVRLISCALRSFELWGDNKGANFWGLVWRSFKGVHEQGSKESDFWFPYILGCLELLAYPILIKTGAFTVIGAWLGFKTLAQWEHWKVRRQAFNRFLIGNALIVFASQFLVYEGFIRFKT
ncbi:MAG: hypothetical protein ISP45_05155 [Reyranella sp.]|jgi:hypothetical protein|nr:hypothetical protein [Reyranella sp.]